jgi:hypothetical protein
MATYMAIQSATQDKKISLAGLSELFANTSSIT